MKRLTILTSAASLFALAGCLGAPAIVGVGDDDDGGGSGSADDADGSNGDADSADDGDADGADDGADDGVDDGGDDTGPQPACAGIDAFGGTPQATLTPSQYDSTVRDLTGAAGPFAVGASIDEETVAEFSLGMDVAGAAALAPEVAAAVDLEALLPCDPTTTDEAEQDACYTAFTPEFARLAWRRPVLPGDLEAQAAAFAGNEDFATRMRAVIASVLAAEDFLVLSRAGTPSAEDPALVVLDAHALATRLAMFLWNSGPDDQLLDLADSGELLDPEVLHAEAERLLGDARAARMVDDLHTQWLQLDELEHRSKDPEVFPEYDAALGQDMVRGTLAFVRSIVIGGSGELRDLLTQPSSFANASLASIYGDDIVGPVPSGATFESVMLDPVRRGGLLGEPSFAATFSHPDQIGFTLRGLFIRQAFLCSPIPPPPPGVEMDLGPVPHEASHKETWEVVFAEPSCHACHELTDQISFAFDNYDAIGRWTEDIDGFPVDASGELDGTAFAGRAELVEMLLGAESFPACVVDHYARYALDRMLLEDDECTRDSLVQALVESDGNVRVLALAMVDSDAFRVARLD